MFPCARFDDHTAGAERAFSLRGLQETVVARRVDDVIPALERVLEATAEGLWAGGYVAYEAAPAFHPDHHVRLREVTDPFGHLPLVWFGLFDRRENAPPFRPRAVRPAPYNLSAWKPEIGPNDYAAGVRAVKRAIDTGECRQATFSTRLRAAFNGEPHEYYRDLVLAQRGAYAAYFDVGRYRVLSASPELFFRIDGTRLTTRPVKGTARRGRWLAEDRELARRLTTSEKERAENLIVVDQVAADLERVAVPGTVTIQSALELERYETLWQLGSEITAEVARGVTWIDVFRAMFPASSVTGVPGTAAMELITELERSPRGVYAGAIGLVSPPDAAAPRAIFNVGIRTVTLDVEEGVAEYGAGGGITRDSSPEAEYEEARLKARLLVERRPEFELIETIRWDDDRGFWWLDEHMERMGSSADYFGFRFDRSSAELRLRRAVDGLTGSRAVHLTLLRDGTMRVEVDDAILPPLVDGPEGAVDHVELALDEDPVSTSDVFLFHSTTNRRAYDERMARHDADDVLVCNERGEITQAAHGNVAVRFGETWWTPPLDSGCLQGVMRRALLEKGALKERSIACHELQSASGIAVFDSLRGWRPAELQTGDD